MSPLFDAVSPVVGILCAIASMHLKTLFRLSWFLILCWSLPAGAQQTGESLDKKSLTYGFVSPNTREGLKLEEAIRGLSSREEEKLLRNARRLHCVAQSKIGTMKAIGSWTDGAEHSMLLRLHTNVPTVRYVVSLLGRAADQKAALYFHSDAAGQAEMYTLRPNAQSKSLSSLARLLDQLGIKFRTLVPTRSVVLIYVVDLKRDMRAKIIAAARKLKARVTTRRGTAEFVGDDSSREKAKAIFDEEIKNYELKNSALVTKCQNQSILLHNSLQTQSDTSRAESTKSPTAGDGI